MTRAVVAFSLIIASALAQSPADPVGADIRRARGALFDTIYADDWRGGPILESTDPRAPTPVTTIDSLPMEELPVALADVILVGQTVRTQPFETNSHRAIYTETTVLVYEVMSEKAGKTRPGALIALEHPGGSVRLPNGRVITYDVRGLGAPFENNQRYAFFLTWLPKGECYKVTKAWWLEDGRAKAMSPDDLGRVSAGTSRFDNMPETQFLGVLRQLR